MGWSSLIASAVQTAAKAQAGGMITYLQPGKAAVSLSAARGFAEIPMENLLGVGISAKSLDWFIKSADLAIEGEPFEPKIGDLITTEDGYRFKVVGKDQGRDCFAYMDGFNATMQVFSKYVGRA